MSKGVECLSPVDRSPEGLGLLVVPESARQVSDLVVGGLVADSLAEAGHIVVAEVEADRLRRDLC